MINKIENIFSGNGQPKLSVYFTAGFPGLNDLGLIMNSLQEGGADLVEVGLPFSDPIADGPTIQASNKVALQNGISLKLILEQLAKVKNEISIPVILMGYLNPIYQYGIEKFCEDSASAGASGMIIPDLPMKEYLESYKGIFERNNLLNIFLISPQTSGERVRLIDRNSRGFIYMVSAASTTGAKKEISGEQVQYFERINKMNLKNPRLIGFGISDHATFQTACLYAGGAIIGSAFIKLLGESKNLKEDIINYIHTVKGN